MYESLQESDSQGLTPQGHLSSSVPGDHFTAAPHTTSKNFKTTEEGIYRVPKSNEILTFVCHQTMLEHHNTLAPEGSGPPNGSGGKRGGRMYQVWLILNS